MVRVKHRGTTSWPEISDKENNRDAYVVVRSKLVFVRTGTIIKLFDRGVFIISNDKKMLVSSMLREHAALIKNFLDTMTKKLKN